MQCIFEYCVSHSLPDLFAFYFYATAILVTLCASLFSRSRDIQTAALLISGSWVLANFSYFFIKLPAHYLAIATLNAAVCLCFWRMAQRRIVAAPLCLIHLVETAFIAAALAAGLSTWWTLFTLNRLFELTLLYLIGASMFRLHLRRRQAKSQAPLTGWRASFVAG